MSNLDKVEEQVEEVINKGMNQKHFTVLVILLAIGASVLVILNGFASPSNMAAMITAQINAVALFLASVFGLIFFFLGLKVNVYKEIVEEHNMSLALLLASIILGIATCISKAAL